MTSIVYVDMDDVMCDFTSAYQLAKKSNPEIEFPQSVPRFYLELEPIAEAIETVNLLRQKFDVYVLTAPSTHNPLCYTEKRIWIEDKFDFEFTNKLIISPNKGLLIGDYLIDDHDRGRGQESFQGKLLQFGTSPFESWIQIRKFFKV